MKLGVLGVLILLCLRKQWVRIKSAFSTEAKSSRFLHLLTMPRRSSFQAGLRRAERDMDDPLTLALEPPEGA